MQITAVRLRPLVPPKDSLKRAIRESSLKLREGDIVTVSSKVVSIDEGECIPIEGTDRDALVKKESQWYYDAPRAKYRHRFTITRGYMPGGAGVDESNGNGYYILYPEDPFKSARTLRSWLRKTYGIKSLGLVITDSVSLPLRRGAIGYALAWDGIDPMRDYRGTKDIFGRPFQIEVANLVDPLASASVLVMGEGREQTPIAVVRGANVPLRNRSLKEDPLMVPPHDDLFAPLLWKGKRWKRGGQRE